jgi:DNA-binding winged helix-turn-helix (wHTH) protein
MRIRFGKCVLDSETRELSVSGQPVHLTPEAFELLEILIESRPRAVSKTEIHEKLWRDTFVSDGTLTSLLAEVRSAIGDSGGTIRTVHRFGYAFSIRGARNRELTAPAAPRVRLPALLAHP